MTTESSRIAHFRTILRTMIALATGALGFVAALAWNDAIKAKVGGKAAIEREVD